MGLPRLLRHLQVTQYYFHSLDFFEILQSKHKTIKFASMSCWMKNRRCNSSQNISICSHLDYSDTCKSPYMTSTVLISLKYYNLNIKRYIFTSRRCLIKNIGCDTGWIINVPVASLFTKSNQ